MAREKAPCRRAGFRRQSLLRSAWLRLRFSLSIRDDDQKLPERGIGFNYEAVRRWVLNLGPLIATHVNSGMTEFSEI